VSSAGRLVDERGDVRTGIFAEPIREVNHRDYLLLTPLGRRAGALRRRFGFKQFQFLGGLSESLLFGCALADVKLAGTAFVYCFEPSTRRFVEQSFQRPLALGFHATPTPESGTASFRAGGVSFEMAGTASPPERRLTVRTKRITVDAVFHDDDPAIAPMRICTPAGATGWVYARKTAGQRVTGCIEWDGGRVDLAAVGMRGHHDWSAGFMRRQTFWNWGCLAGVLPDGRAVGLNVSCGVNETSFTENCFWLDGTLHKLDTVQFVYDRRALDEPWAVRSYDGRLSLEFRPAGRHAERVNALVLASDFNQLFGRYHGWLATADGQRIAIDGLPGYIERHYAKW
jgi:uncharacterized protein DUF2804